ncbi:XisI protein [Anabaenopsis tanganyikae CS-531]|uniref:XisI protein n=2 Tax=Anabaenopsis TaxID=110103 RepID=A0ABT6KG84_9CYAN|nr:MULTISPECIES: element excision factor XisI family protein [Anabaenopsis]MDB9538247.1 element excision factor XisI family protein [Anabaenopsis arnoldii]MDH6090300.1 XisI protein [Anabaenopsis arnoldii]MDH6106359.1 XisI protein [Anabaenopsis tanganyikae CS-531]
MEKIEQYRTYIQTLLTEYAQGSPSDHEVETQLIFDKERDHYQVVYTGKKSGI